MIRLGGDEHCYTTSVQAEVRRTQLCNCVKKHCSEFGYFLTASALNARLNKMLPKSQSGREFLTFAYYNIEDNTLISKCEKPSDNKTFRVSEKTIKKDLKILVDRGVIEAHQQTVVLDGKRYSPVVVYGSLDAFRAEIEQARTVLDGREQLPVKSQKVRQDPVIEFPVDAKPPVAAADDEPLPFSQDIADKLRHYCISRDQWRKDTVGGALAVVTFASLIDEVDDKVREAVLKIPAPEIFSANLALKQVLANRPSGLKMLSRWIEN